MKDRADRQWELDRLDRLEPILAPMRDALMVWEVKMDRLVARKTGFAKGVGELAFKVSYAATTYGGRLFVGRQVDTKTAQQGGMGGLRSQQYVEMMVGEMKGPDLFRRFDPLAAVREALIAVDAIDEAFDLDETDGIPTALLRRRRKAFEDTFEKLDIAAKMYAAGQEFFTQESFEGLVKWTDKYAITKDRYIFDGEGIIYDDGRPGVRLPYEPFKDLDETPLDLIREYRRAD